MLKYIISTYRERFRLWVRQRTKPISVEEAEEKRFFWAKMYALTCLLFLFVCTRNVYLREFNLNDTNEMLEKMSPVIQNENKPVRILKYQGFTKESDITYSAEELNKYKKKPSSYE